MGLLRAALPGNRLTSLQPMKRSPELRPGRHQHHLGVAAGRLRNEMRDLVRRGDVGAERLVERIDQRVVAQHAVDIVSGDDAHQPARRDRERRLSLERRHIAARRRGVEPAAQIARLGLGAARPHPPLGLAEPGGDAADHHAERHQHEDQHEQRQLASRRPDAPRRTDRTRR